MKKILTVIIAVSMLASYSAIDLTANAVDNTNDENIITAAEREEKKTEASMANQVFGDYEYSAEGNNVSIVKYKGSGRSVVIPEKIDGKKVTKIESQAFYNCDTLKSITLPDSITDINYNAFKSCDQLEEINYPKSLIKTGFDILSECPNIQKVVVPEGVTVLTTFFRSAEGVKEIVLPSTLKTISIGAFDGCTGLSKINIPDSVLSIESEAFENCSSIKEIKIPDSVTSIGYRAFAGCKSLVSINYPAKLSSAGYGVLTGCSSLKKVEVPEGVRVLTQFFYEADYITEIQLPDTLTTICNSAFKGCKNLGTINIPSKVNEIGEYAFEYCSSINTLKLSDKITNIGYRAFYDCTGLERINYPAKLSYAGVDVLTGCSSLTKVEVPEGVRELTQFFCNADYVTEVQLPSTLTTICDNAFKECTSLEKIEIPDNVTSIGDYAFEKCSSITKISLPNGVKSIGYKSFNSCVALESINFPLSLEKTGSDILGNCNNLVKITVPEGVTVIPSNAFCGANYLEEISLPGTLESIGSYAFKNCSNISKLEIPQNVTSIEEGSFEDCSSLESITIPDSVKTINSNTFSNCRGLSKIEIPERVSSINYHAFYNCPNLTIYGYGNTKAESYANENNIPFVNIGEGHKFIEDAEYSYVSDYDYSPNSSDCEPKPEITFDGEKLTEGVDFKYEYVGNDKAGDATVKVVGIGQFVGTLEIPFRINPISIYYVDDKTELHEYEYTGSAIEPEIMLTYKGAALKKDVDYTVAYTNNIEPGIATVTVMGIGNYSKELSYDFLINEKSIKILMGDIDGDHEVSSSDSLMVLRNSVGLESFTDEQLSAADMDGDREITSSDALIILRRSVGLI